MTTANLFILEEMDTFEAVEFMLRMAYRECESYVQSFLDLTKDISKAPDGTVWTTDQVVHLLQQANERGKLNYEILENKEVLSELSKRHEAT